MKTRTKQPTFTDARGREHSTAEFAAAADRINTEAQPTTPPSQNEEWGFYGTMATAYPGREAQAWPIAIAEIARATGQPTDSARAFLDSRHGRHFADDVISALYSLTSNQRSNQEIADATAKAAQIWMGWRIGRRQSRETGIPAGLPYLTGHVVQEAITAEIADEEACATEERIPQKAAGLKAT